MAFCNKCGVQLASGAAFCANCGQAQPTAPVTSDSQSGLSENAASTLSYLLGWVTGLIFLLIDKRPRVRFHAAQSLVTFGGLHIIRRVLAGVFGYGFIFGGPASWTDFSLGIGILWLIGVFSFILWIVLMIKASQGERFKLPVAGDIAENLAGK